MVSQEWLSAMSCFIIWKIARQILIGTDDFRDGNQGKDKRISGKTFQYEMSCNEQADDAVAESAV